MSPPKGSQWASPAAPCGQLLILAIPLRVVNPNLVPLQLSSRGRGMWGRAGVTSLSIMNSWSGISVGQSCYPLRVTVNTCRPLEGGQSQLGTIAVVWLGKRNVGQGRSGEPVCREILARVDMSYAPCHPDWVIIQGMDVAELCFVPSLCRCLLRTIRPSSPIVPMELQWGSQGGGPAAPSIYNAMKLATLPFCVLSFLISLCPFLISLSAPLPPTSSSLLTAANYSREILVVLHFVKPGNYFMMDVIDHSGDIFIHCSEIDYQLIASGHYGFTGLGSLYVSESLPPKQSGYWKSYHVQDDAQARTTSSCAVEGAQLIVIVDQYPTSAAPDNTHTSEQSQWDDEKGACTKSIKYIINSETPTVFTILDGGVTNKQYSPHILILFRTSPVPPPPTLHIPQPSPRNSKLLQEIRAQFVWRSLCNVSTQRYLQYRLELQYWTMCPRREPTLAGMTPQLAEMMTRTV
ncbi:hypothetical protein EI94DRAFT_1699685 [Lactarius quietus]|nr:hypothetical protein EI94DRAFT_1699685 [Lactarius quietus]